MRFPQCVLKNKYKNESVAQAQKYTKAWNNVNF